MLSFDKVVIKTNSLGEESIVPDIHNKKNNLFFIVGDGVTEEDNLSVGEGMFNTMLPYKMQNMYNRELVDTEYNAAILENEFLKAVFLPELGGRLWSLFDKKMNREIVYENDAVRFGNLALRNAWCAGGVEWNIGLRGHSPLTCSTLFTQKLKAKDGGDVLKMYEYEDKRGLVYSIMARLNKDELLIKIEVENVKEHPTYMYWWSNIAVAETKDSRVITPTNESFITAYQNGGFKLSKKSIPMVDGKDISYPINSSISIDYFYDIPDDSNKWISCIDSKGQGLLQMSSDRLYGRKCFLWGNEQGGKHWNEWLTGGRDYLEIQAGLNKTQFEHFLLEPHEKLNWIEVYKGVDIGSNEGDYLEVVNKIDANTYKPDCHAPLFECEESKEFEMLGTARGYIESLLNKKPLCDWCDFSSDSFTNEYKYYIDLLNNESEGEYPLNYLSNIKWVEIIEAKHNKSSFDYYMQGIVYYANDLIDEASVAFHKSVELEETYYSLIALALIYANINEDYQKGFDLIEKAIKLKPDYLPLAYLYGEMSISSKNYQAFPEFVKNASNQIKNSGRVQMYLGNCYVQLGDIENALNYINEDLVIADMKEGEYSISNIWVELYRKILSNELNVSPEKISDKEVLDKYPIPYSIDFRMH